MQEDELYSAFLAAAGEQAAQIGDVRYALEQMITEWNRSQVGLPEAEPRVVGSKSSNSTSGSSSKQSGGGDSALVQVLKSGFGVAPLIGSLIGLFGGGGDEAPPALVKYAMPTSVQFEAASRGGQITTADYDQAGMARAYPSSAAASGSTQAQVTVNVQAMDARSFLDRSGDIAMAVRDAMLNLNSINDVVNDL